MFTEFEHLQGKTKTRNKKGGRLLLSIEIVIIFLFLVVGFILLPVVEASLVPRLIPSLVGVPGKFPISLALPFLVVVRVVVPG